MMVINRVKYFDNICGKIIKSFEGEREIISAYAYGSILSSHFDSKKSDVDILLIVNDQKDSHNFNKRIKNISNAFKWAKLDVNIVFFSEFKKRWHIYRPPSYFVGIKHKNKLLFGKDLIKSVRDSEITEERIYKRIVDLAQGSRGIYVNSKEPDFWTRKYVGWLKVVVLEILFLAGELDLFFNSGCDKLKKRFKELDFAESLKRKNLTIRDVNKIAEKLREFMLSDFLKK